MNKQSKLKMRKEELKVRLSKNTEECMTALFDSIKTSNPYYNDLILISKRYKEGKSQIIRGVIDYKDWGLMKRQIDASILELIDGIFEEQDDSITIDSILEEKNNLREAIEFLSNVLSGQIAFFNRIYENGDKTSVKNMHDEIIEEVSISDDGDFTIIQTYYDSEVSFNQDKKISETVLDLRLECTGKLKDINKVEIQGVENTEDIFQIVCTTTNFLKNIHIQREGVRKAQYGKFKINDKLESDQLVITVRLEMDMVERIKNALDFISISLGRRMDAF